MKAETRACAASHPEVQWQTIDWHAAHRNVRRLQARIVKAVQEGRWGKVKALQHLLTHSFSGKALAVRRVTENQGKHTPGVDGVSWPTPPQKAQAISELQPRGYHPQPLRRVYLLKRDGKTRRPLSIPTMRDRAMQALYLLALEPVAETTADAHSYGFRAMRSTADALQQGFIVLGKKTSPPWILEADIRACFDTIEHTWLLAHIPLQKAMLQKWLKAGYLEKDVLYPTSEGVPQGGIISPILANMTLDGLQAHLAQQFPRKNDRSQQVNLVRFADDFIVTGKTKELLEEEVLPVIAAFLKARGLELSPHKTHVTHIAQGFDFLGQNVRKYNGKLIIQPAKKNVQAFLTKVRQVIKTHPAISAGSLIMRLNPLIRGWAAYHQHACSSVTYKKVDSALFQALWQWAKRRHNNKGHRWIRAKYFRSVGKRHWVFTGIAPDTEKQPKTVTLRSAALTPIRRHIKIQGLANPFDPHWEPYLEKHRSRLMAQTLQGRNQLWRLWKRQSGLCPHCQQPITQQTGWHLHHRVWRSKGGGEQASNLVLLHPTCHHQVHAQNFSV